MKWQIGFIFHLRNFFLYLFFGLIDWLLSLNEYFLLEILSHCCILLYFRPQWIRTQTSGSLHIPTVILIDLMILIYWLLFMPNKCPRYPDEKFIVFNIRIRCFLVLCLQYRRRLVMLIRYLAVNWWICEDSSRQVCVSAILIIVYRWLRYDWKIIALLILNLAVAYIHLCLFDWLA